MTEQFEQAKKELAEKWGYLTFDYTENNCQDEFLSDLNSLLEQHKEVMIREELIAYDKWLCQHDLGYDFDTTEKCVDEYIKSLKP